MKKLFRLVKLATAGFAAYKAYQQFRGGKTTTTTADGQGRYR